MSEDQVPAVIAVPEEANPIEPFADRKVFQHVSLGLHLELRKSVNELVQRDLDNFMRRFTEQTQGNSIAEDNGKTLRAAFRADWIDSLSTPAGRVMTGNDVDGMKPAHVRWVATIIDKLYSTAREIPNA